MNKSEQIYRFIKEYIRAHGYAPTRREIASGCDIASTRSVQEWLRHLAEANRLKFDPGVSRSIVLLGRDGPRPRAARDFGPLPE